MVLGQRKGAEKMTSLTDIHESDVCTADNGRMCEMCRWVESEAVKMHKRETADFILNNELADYASAYDFESLTEQVDAFLAGHGVLRNGAEV